MVRVQNSSLSRVVTPSEQSVVETLLASLLARDDNGCCDDAADDVHAARTVGSTLRHERHVDLLPVNSTTGIAARAFSRDRDRRAGGRIPRRRNRQLVAPRPANHMADPTERVAGSATLLPSGDNHGEPRKGRGAR